MKRKEKDKLGRSHFIMMFFAFSFGMILSNLILQGGEKQNVPKTRPLFVYKGIDKTLEDVPLEVKSQLLALAEKRRSLIELAALEQHLQQYAHDRGLSLNKAGNELFELKDIDEQRVHQFYNDNEAKLGQPLYQLQESITEHLRVQQLKRGKQKVLKSLSEQGDLMFFHE